MSFINHPTRICFLLILLLQQAFCQTLDNAYGNGDGFTTANMGLLYRSEMLNDNSVIVQSRPDFYKFSKFDAQGNRDMAFGTNGYLYPYDQSGATGPQGHSNLIIDQQQRIVIGMYEFVGNVHSIKLKRYFQDGTRDMSFGTAGVFVYPIQAQIQPLSPTFCFFSDQSMLLHICMQSALNLPSLLVKLNPDGILDTAFGTNGTVTIPAGANSLLFSNRTVAIDENDNIILFSRTNVSPYNHFINKFNSLGAPDTTFGTVTVNELTGYYRVVIWLRDGKIYVATHPDNGSNTLRVIRLNMDGSLDSGFNDIIIDQTNYYYRLESEGVIIDRVGKVIAVGMIMNEAGTIAQKGVVKCYNDDGTVDTAFDNDGEVTFDYNWSHFIYPLVQSDNKIVVTGVCLNSSLTGNTTWNAMLLRYTTNNLSVDGIGPNTSVALFPNPASTNFTIAPDTSEKVELYDALGRFVKTYPGKSTSYSLDGLENGLFILRIFTDSGISVQKLLKN